MEGVSVHRIKINNRSRYVNCLRDYNDPKEKCPFCADNRPIEARLIIPVYNIDEKEVQLWDRGKTMFARMTRLCSKYASNGKNLVSTIFEIERCGAANSTDTTYEILPLESDDAKLEDFPVNQVALSNLVLDKTADEMEYFLDHHNFPGYDESSNNSNSGRSHEDDIPTRRRSSERRTPSNREVF